MKQFAIILLAGIFCVIAVGCGGTGAAPPAPPVLSVSSNSESFTAVQGGANPPAASVTVSNTGGGTLAFSAVSDSPWLTTSPASGIAPQTLQISATVGMLPVGMNTGHVTVIASDIATSPAIVTVSFFVTPQPSETPFWSQWGANPQHAGMVSIAGQNAAEKLADIIYDPFVTQEKAENTAVFGEAVLTVHYQAQLTDGNDVYAMMKTGTYNSCSPAGAWFTQNAACGPNTWNTMVWNEARFSWINNQLTQIWIYASDWKPEPNGNGLEGWEPVFHPVDANNFIYVPGAGGTIWKVNKTTGVAASHINPFSGANIAAANTYVASPLSADSQGNIYYTVIELAAASQGDPWTVNDAVGAWLVKVKSDDTSSIATFTSLVPNAPAGSSTACLSQFSHGPNGLCGSQRPGINIAPAIGPDGTIYIGSVAHFSDGQAYVVAVNSNLTPKWSTLMQSLLSDACGGSPPCTLGSGLISDLGSSSPTVAPDGSVLFGAFTSFNGGRGHLMKFDSLGNFQGDYTFGWDSTPAIYLHNGTYSIVIKDNNYSSGGPYYITQLNPSLQIEWQFQSTNTNSSHPDGYEWCINMPAVDVNGIVYANSEDGNIYVIPQGHTGIFTQPLASLFLNSAIGAAYTPLSIGPDGKLYTQNNGHLYAIGN
jgi:BACON domain-containing protein